MKKILSILILSMFILSPVQSSTKTKLTVKDIRDKGFQLTHVSARDDYVYLIFQKGNEIYSCSGSNSSGYRCFHLTDGKR